MTMPVSHPVYPFSALVGQERLKQALILNAINPRIGGVLIRGEKGTAKSTAVRGLARLLPPIRVVQGSPYHCPPESPLPLCPVCRSASENGHDLPIHEIPTPLVELPVSASEDRVVGSLDLEHAITEGERRFEPGLLARVNRGMLYVDEVNLLDDHLVDLLLDAAAMGVNTVEREGISVSHPAQFILVGTMNPEEGELRPQLLDRFGLAVEITGLSDPAQRIAVIERRMEYEADPDAFKAQWQTEEQRLHTRIVAARSLVGQVRIRKPNMALVAQLALELGVDGHRADLTILEAARAHAAWQRRKTIMAQDIQVAAELALPHRMRRQPFLDIANGTTYDRIRSALEQSSKRVSPPTEGADRTHEKKNDTTGSPLTMEEQDITQATPDAEWDGSPEMTVASQHPSERPDSGQNTARHPSDTTFVHEAGDLYAPQRLEGLCDRKKHRATGRRTSSRTSRKQGRYITSKREAVVTDLALDATLRVAAPYQRQRRTSAAPHRPARKIVLTRDDLRQKVRIRRTRNAICFVVDASWSMSAEERMQATRDTILSLLQDAYQRRDHVGLVSFQRTNATILLPLTSSVERAQKCLQTMPIGGKTPLARGLLTGYDVLEKARRHDPEVIPLMVVITDGQANVSIGPQPPHAEVYQIAHHIAASNIRTIVIDTEYSSMEPGMVLGTIASAHTTRTSTPIYTLQRGQARQLAEHLQGQYYRLDELQQGGMTHMIRAQLDS